MPPAPWLPARSRTRGRGMKRLRSNAMPCLSRSPAQRSESSNATQVHQRGAGEHAVLYRLGVRCLPIHAHPVTVKRGRLIKVHRPYGDAVSTTARAAMRIARGVRRTVSAASKADFVHEFGRVQAQPSAMVPPQNMAMPRRNRPRQPSDPRIRPIRMIICTWWPSLRGGSHGSA